MLRRILVLLVVVMVLRVGAVEAKAAVVPSPLRVGIVGLVHDHVRSFLGGGNLVPAGGILDRPDVVLVGVVEPNQQLFDKYAKQYHLAASLHFNTIAEMVAATHPQAALLFTAASDHRTAVEECAALGVNVLMEKPLAFKYEDALAMQRAAEKGHIHVLVDYETSWYASNAAATSLQKSGELGPLVKTVVRDGHGGPKLIGVQPEFLAWLTDPAKNGDGALTDFGCYGPDLVTWLMDGEVPQSVTAVTKRMQPDVYTKVDDEAEIVLNYRNAVSIIEASWNWPFSVKQMDVYGRTGYAKTLDATHLEVRKAKDHDGSVVTGEKLQAPYDDPLHYLIAVLNGEVQEGNSLSSLKTNMTVTEILDAAWRSAQTGKTVELPLR